MTKQTRTTSTDTARDDWHAELTQVRSLRDKLGRPVDPPLESVVAALRLHGYRTISSCGGHIREYPRGPYVLVQSSAARYLQRKAEKDPEQDDELYAVLRRTATRYQSALLLDLLTVIAAFYDTRPSPEPPVRLTVNSLPWTMVNVSPAGSDILPCLTRAEQIEMLARMRQELNDFAFSLRKTQPSRRWLLRDEKRHVQPSP